MFKKNEMDEAFEIAKNFDMSELKMYPGSDKGPQPEDDPDNYTKWFVQNYPKSLKESDWDFDGNGVKIRMLKNT